MLDTWRAAYFINAFGNLFGQCPNRRVYLAPTNEAIRHYNKC